MDSSNVKSKQSKHKPSTAKNKSEKSKKKKISSDNHSETESQKQKSIRRGCPRTLNQLLQDYVDKNHHKFTSSHIHSDSEASSGSMYYSRSAGNIPDIVAASTVDLRSNRIKPNTVSTLESKEQFEINREMEKYVKERELFAIEKESHKKEMQIYYEQKSNIQKEIENYEKEKRKKKDKLRDEIDALRKQRNEAKVAIKLEQLKQERDLMEKQKELNDMQGKLHMKEENIQEREQTLQHTLSQLENAEAAIEKRKEILKKKQEELTEIAHTQDLGVLKKQLNEHKLTLRRKSKDGAVPQRELAQLNWNFVRSVFQDRTAMMESILSDYKEEISHLEHELCETNQKVSKFQVEIQVLQQTVKRKDKKIRELEEQLTSILQKQESESNDVPEPSKSVSFSGTDDENLDPREDNRGYFSRRKSQRKSISGDPMKMDYDFGEDKYVSQTCSVM